MKAYTTIFDDNQAKRAARFPARNFTDVTSAEVKKEAFDYLLLQSGSVDITNLDTAKDPEKHAAYFKQEVIFSAKRLFSVAEAALESQPSLKKVVIFNQTPR